MLGKIADLKALTTMEGPRLGVKHFANAFNQGGFTGTVDTQNADALTGADRELHTTQNDFLVVTQLNAFSID